MAPDGGYQGRLTRQPASRRQPACAPYLQSIAAQRGSSESALRLRLTPPPPWLEKPPQASKCLLCCLLIWQASGGGERRLEYGIVKL